MVPFWEVIDRALRSGPLVKVNDFEKRLFRKASECVRKYEIRYNPETPVVSDDGMVSRLFEAGLELYSEVGTYSLNSERVFRAS
jgi:hypothetical protein